MLSSFESIETSDHRATTFGEIAAMALQRRPNWRLTNQTKTAAEFIHARGATLTILTPSDSLKDVTQKVIEEELYMIMMRSRSSSSLLEASLTIAEEEVDSFFSEATIENRPKLSRVIPFRIFFMANTPLLAIFFTPATPLGIAADIVLAFLMVIVIKASFSSIWSEYKYLGPFTILSVLFVGGILWISSPPWLSFVFSALLVLSFATILGHIMKSKSKGIS